MTRYKNVLIVDHKGRRTRVASRLFKYIGQAIKEGMCVKIDITCDERTGEQRLSGTLEKPN